MKHSKHMPESWKIKRCSCGQCDDYWITPPGRFIQGSGFNKQTAEFIVQACKSHHKLKDTCAFLKTMQADLETVNAELLEVCKTMAIYWKGSSALIATQLNKAIANATK